MLLREKPERLFDAWVRMKSFVLPVQNLSRGVGKVPSFFPSLISIRIGVLNIICMIYHILAIVGVFAVVVFASPGQVAPVLYIVYPHGFAHTFIKGIGQRFIRYAEIEIIGIDKARASLAKALQYHFCFVSLKYISPFRKLLEESFAVTFAIWIVVKPVNIARAKKQNR
jgi:hypothetical protein